MTELARPALSFDRVISPALEHAIAPDGELHWLLQHLTEANPHLDVHLRASQANKRSWVSAYYGLTTILDLHQSSTGFWLNAHPTHRIAGFDEGWAVRQPAASLTLARSAVCAYIDTLLTSGGVNARHTEREGRVQTLLAQASADSYGIMQREAVVSFRSETERSALVDPFRSRIEQSMSAEPSPEPWWPGVRNGGRFPNLGLEADLLGIDHLGRLLVIEVKPSDAIEGIAWAPGQARLYAEIFALWLEVDPNAAETITEMSDQRARLALPSARWRVPQQSQIRVVPVVAIGDGSMSPKALQRLEQVHAALGRRPSLSARLDPLEVWQLDAIGRRVSIWRPGLDPRPTTLAPVSRQTFDAVARAAAIEWKVTSEALSEGARDPGLYLGAERDFCLPVDCAAENLLIDARQIALDRFEAAAITWHVSGRTPTNHLLSSQVQCANALAPLVNQPSALAQLFGDVLDIAEVLPFAETASAGSPVSPHDRTDHVVFEWIGLANHLNEWGPRPTRGANVTSADAAFRYRTNAGTCEVALIEWKYTERYTRDKLSGSPTSNETRVARYKSLYEAPDGPIDTEKIALEELFAEPIYQLARLALLARAMENTGELGADAVRVVYVAPKANRALWASPGTLAFRALAAAPGGRFDDVWRSLLRDPDRFVSLDSAMFVRLSSPTSQEFKTRYAHLDGEL